jgi:uncharacterized protein YciI
MFDLVDHRHLKQLLIDFDTQMKPIVAICHGVVGLINVRRTNDSNPFIHGRALTGFSLEEELKSSNDEDNSIVKNPFILETKLKDQGATYLKSTPGKEYIVQDGLLLTGQNPASANQLAHRFGELITQCATQDYQQVNLTSSLPKTLVTCHVALNNTNNSHLLSRLKLAHLEYIQRHQHLIVLSGSTLFVEPSNLTQQDSSTMVILLATNDLRKAQQFIEHEPYTASKQIFDITQIKPFKPLFPSVNNQQILNYHIQQELFKSHHHHHRQSTK